MIKPQSADAGPSQKDQATADKLAPLLVKLSALAGVAVPLNRFAFPRESSDGIEFPKLAPANQAVELWKARFLDGEAQAIRFEEISKATLPLLWIGEAKTELTVGIIRGIQNRGFLVEGVDGETSFLEKEAISAGKTLKLSVGSSELLVDEQSGYTAKQWFYRAIKERRSIFFEAIFATFMLSIFGLTSALYTMRL